MTSNKMFLVEELLLNKKSSLSGSKDEGFRMKFEFLKADTPSSDKRIYPKRVLAKAVEEAQARIDAGRPLSGSTRHVPQGLEVDDISHLLERLFMDGSSAWTEAHLLPTERGRNLMALIQGGASIGVSARGLGTLSTVEGKQVVNDDYVLKGVDFVLSPSMGTYVDSSNIFESASFDGLERPTENSRRRWEQAVRFAGYKGSLKDYQKLVATWSGETVVSMLFQGAKAAGYQGSFPDFRDQYLNRSKK
jgi:hypothetical protein